MALKEAKDEPDDIHDVTEFVTMPFDDIDAKDVKERRQSTSSYRTQKFCSNWLFDPFFKDWLRRDKDPSRAVCIVCMTKLVAGKSELQRHAKAKKHANAMRKYNCRSKPFVTIEEPYVLDGLDSTAISSISGGDNLNPAKLGFIGCGNMAQALLGGFLKNGLVEPGSIIVSAPSETNRNKVRMLGVRTTHDNNVVVNESDMVFICIKPHVVHEVIQALDPLEADHSPLFVSVVSGIKIARLEELLKNVTPYPRVIRTMPNTPCLVSQGCCVYSIGQDVESSEGGVVRCLLSSVGFCEEVKEELIDSVCGLAGSGPAYVYAAIEALADGGVKMGLPRALAQNLAAHMVKGASSMVIETGRHPAQLKDEVCSPGGTTIEGLHVIEKLGLRNALITAVESATLKAKQLGGEK